MCIFYGDCPFNTAECEENNGHYKCKHRVTGEMVRIGDRVDTSIKAIIEANRHPETFICDICGRTKYQNQSDTQQKGWPICHRMTMKAHKLNDWKKAS